MIYNPPDSPWITTSNRLVPMATESSDSPQVKLIHEWRQGFQTRNLDLIAKALHKDFRFVISPQSLGRPEQTREEWLERYKGILSHYTAGPEVSYIGCSNPLRRN
jgi:hypothetical protein